MQKTILRVSEDELRRIQLEIKPGNNHYRIVVEARKRCEAPSSVVLAQYVVEAAGDSRSREHIAALTKLQTNAPHLVPQYVAAALVATPSIHRKNDIFDEFGTWSHLDGSPKVDLYYELWCDMLLGYIVAAAGVPRRAAHEDLWSHYHRGAEVEHWSSLFSALDNTWPLPSSRQSLRVTGSRDLIARHADLITRTHPAAITGLSAGYSLYETGLAPRNAEVIMARVADRVGYNQAVPCNKNHDEPVRTSSTERPPFDEFERELMRRVRIRDKWMNREQRPRPMSPGEFLPPTRTDPRRGGQCYKYSEESVVLLWEKYGLGDNEIVRVVHGDGSHHHFVLTPDGLLVDLTARQFSDAEGFPLPDMYFTPYHEGMKTMSDAGFHLDFVYSLQEFVEHAKNQLGPTHPDRARLGLPSYQPGMYWRSEQ